MTPYSIPWGSPSSTAQQQRNLRLASQHLNNSLSNSNIENCNRLFYVCNNVIEANRLWELGKQLGVTYMGEE